jgi:hypothetical protein
MNLTWKARAKMKRFTWHVKAVRAGLLLAALSTSQMSFGQLGSGPGGTSEQSLGGGGNPGASGGYGGIGGGASEDGGGMIGGFTPSPDFHRKMRGVVRLTYAIKVSGVLAHIQSAAAVVLTKDGSSGGRGTPVLATLATLFDPPEGDWFQNAAQESLVHEIYVQDVIEDEASSEQTSVHMVFGGGMGGMGGGGMGGMGGMGPGGMGGGGMGVQEGLFQLGLRIPGFSQPLYQIGSYTQLDDMRTKVDHLAIVFAQNVNVQLEEISLLVNKSKGLGFNPKLAEAYSLADSPIPERVESGSSKRSQFIVGESGFLAIVQHDPKVDESKPDLNTIYSPAVGLLNAYFQATKRRGDVIRDKQALTKRFESPTAGSDPTLAGATNKSKLLVDALTAVQNAKSSEARKESISQLENLLALQFDAQRSVKQMEIRELRERIEELEKDEQSRISRKAEIVGERLKSLIGE